MQSLQQNPFKNLLNVMGTAGAAEASAVQSLVAQSAPDRSEFGVQFPAFIIRAAIEPPAYICSVPSPRIIAPAHCRGRFTKEHALRAGVP